MESEKQLLKEARKGDRAAMRRLYERYAGYAMAICLRYIPSRDDVNDVMQDSFVKVLTSLGSFEYRGEGSLRSWIARIVANEALDFVRRNAKITYTDDIPDEEEPSEPNLCGISDEALSDMIGRLPDGYRMVLNMYVFEEMSHKEIAQRLGISAGTSASQYFHAKKMLAQMINEYRKQL